MRVDQLCLAALAAAILLAPACRASPCDATREPDGGTGAGGPIIDMHVHALRLELQPGTPTCPGLTPTIDPKDALDFSKFVTCQRPIFAADSDADLRTKSITEMRRDNIRRAITDGARQMFWPGVFGGAVESITVAPFLNASQKRDILYNNAARFLRADEIVRDHRAAQ